MGLDQENKKERRKKQENKPSCKPLIDVLILRKYLEKEMSVHGGKGKGGKHFEKENIFLGRRRKRRKLFGYLEKEN